MHAHAHAHRLIVGMCVGVPIIILIVVGIILLYCICAHYQNKNIQRLAATYSRNPTQCDDDFLAPPPYTASNTSTKTTTDTDLPAYTTTDPYSACVATPTAIQDAKEEQEDSGNQSCEAAVVVVREDFPLLSDNDTQS